MTLTVAIVHVVVCGAETEPDPGILNAKATLYTMHHTLVLVHKLRPSTRVQERLEGNNQSLCSVMSCDHCCHGNVRGSAILVNVDSISCKGKL